MSAFNVSDLNGCCRVLRHTCSLRLQRFFFSAKDGLVMNFGDKEKVDALLNSFTSSQVC